MKTGGILLEGVGEMGGGWGRCEERGGENDGRVVGGRILIADVAVR